MVKLGVAPAAGSDGSFAFVGISWVPDLPEKPKKGKRKMAEQMKSQSLEEPIDERSRNGQNPTLTRSKTYDPSFCKEAEREATSIQHRNSVPNLMKHAVNFHRAFKELPEDEELLNTFSCAWQREVPYHGRLYVSQDHVCFYCSMLLREVKVVIPVPTISILKKANTALLVPNAISIRTAEGEKFLFGSLRSRENAFQLLRSVCKHLQNSNRNSSLTSTSTSSEHLLKISLTSKQLDQDHIPTEHEMAQDIPDGVSGMQDPSKGPPEQKMVAVNRGGEQTMKSARGWWGHLNLFNTIILIYLFLVVVLLLSSGYIGLRIVQLEEQLTSMGAWPDLDLQERYKTS